MTFAYQKHSGYPLKFNLETQWNVESDMGVGPRSSGFMINNMTDDWNEGR